MLDTSSSGLVQEPPMTAGPVTAVSGTDCALLIAQHKITTTLVHANPCNLVLRVLSTTSLVYIVSAGPGI